MFMYLCMDVYIHMLPSGPSRGLQGRFVLHSQGDGREAAKPEEDAVRRVDRARVRSLSGVSRGARKGSAQLKLGIDQCRSNLQRDLALL